MYCKNLSRALNGKLKCKLFKRVIILDECKKCIKIKPRVNKSINKKSSKLRKLENNRFSILTDDLSKCYFCGNNKSDMHEIFKGSNRLVSMKNGFCVPLCRGCHNRTEIDLDFYRYFQIECEKKYLEKHSLDEFMKIINQNYIKD